jgi:hypothetical protein
VECFELYRSLRSESFSRNINCLREVGHMRNRNSSCSWASNRSRRVDGSDLGDWSESNALPWGNCSELDGLKHWHCRSYYTAKLLKLASCPGKHSSCSVHLWKGYHVLTGILRITETSKHSGAFTVVRLHFLTSSLTIHHGKARLTTAERQ